jgi:hypothetical protein
LAVPAATGAPDDQFTALLNEVATDIAEMRVVAAAARITAFLRANAPLLTKVRPGRWAELVRQAEAHGVPTDALCAALQHAPASAREPSAHPFVAEYVRAMERRLAFRRDGTARCTVVSLGPACSAWSLFNRWGFRDTPASVASFNPFCLAGHRPTSVADMLLGGLAAYAPRDCLLSAIWPDGKVVVRRADAAALWSHHEGERWQADGFRPFRDNIAALMGNLDCVLAERDGVLKVFVFGHTTVNDVARLSPILRGLRDALARRCRGAWRLLALNVPADPKLVPQPLLEALTPRVSLMSMPMPPGGTLNQWWEPAVYNAEGGLAWEQQVAALARAAIRGWTAADR